ncbi:MAG: DUF6345 domain-containing protein [Verrucomicrobia bacterium]|nr:DUF6345 domain-containing protein [Verrucomicrobiota bacterium]
MRSILLGLAISSANTVYPQTWVPFAAVKEAGEHAIMLGWASNTNEVYEVDYAEALNGNPDGSTAWLPLYTEYPSHGTYTFVADAGNYDITPNILHPKHSPKRFYRVKLAEANTSPSNPDISVVSPPDGATLSNTITLQVTASSSEILSEVRLYIDGEQQWPSDDGTNFIINTCEWPNGDHIVFATAASQSGLEGIANGGVITYGRAVSSYVRVAFNNLIASLAFSQPFFEPALGQTQQVTATFAAGVDWTLQIQDASSNTVRTATGSGVSMLYNWDGTGDGGSSIPDGVYTYLLSAQTNGQAYNQGSGGGIDTDPPPVPSFGVQAESTDIFALAPNAACVVPLILYPPGYDTNGFDIFEATWAEATALNSPALERNTINLATFAGVSSGYSGAASQSTRAPQRKPTSGVKGTSGTFGICYKTYATNGFASLHPRTGWPYPLPPRVAIDGQSRTAQTVDYRIRQYRYLARGFEAEMQKSGWKTAFLKEEDQWSAADIKRPDRGGNSIFNTCNFGMLMTHGSYGNTGTTGTEADGVSYTYLWLGQDDYVRLADMDCGSAGTNGLRWMTIYACNILRPYNYDSMNDAGLIPVNEKLHLLIGPSTDSIAIPGIGYEYAHNLTAKNQTIVDAFNNALETELFLNRLFVTNTIKAAVSFWPACINDKLSDAHDPDPLNGLQYQETQVFP